MIKFTHCKFILEAFVNISLRSSLVILTIIDILIIAPDDEVSRGYLFELSRITICIFSIHNISGIN